MSISISRIIRYEKMITKLLQGQQYNQARDSMTLLILKYPITSPIIQTALLLSLLSSDNPHLSLFLRPLTQICISLLSFLPLKQSHFVRSYSSSHNLSLNVGCISSHSGLLLSLFSIRQIGRG